jgi:hypothetical protein
MKPIYWRIKVWKEMNVIEEGKGMGEGEVLKWKVSVRLDEQ